MIANMTIGKKIMLGYGLALLIVTVIGAFSYRSTHLLITTAGTVHRSQEFLMRLERVMSLIEETGNGERGYIITGEDRFLEPYNAAVAAADQAVQEARKLSGDNSSHQKRLDTVESLVASWLAFSNEMIEVRRKEGFEAAQRGVLTARGKKLMGDIRTVIDEIKDEETALLNQRSKDSEASARRTIVVIVGGSIAALVILACVGFVITRSITRPLRQFMQFVEQVGTGDLTQKAANPSRDELGMLGHTLNRMVDGLKDVAAQTRAATETLNSATAEMMASTQQQAASASEQSAAVQETTATVDEISQTGAQISERANRVATAAEATVTTSAAGLQAVQETNRTMEAIREQAEAVAENIVSLSEKTQVVGEIIATVNDIAEQSNLLALNAAIEAASAGEQGRGFSVVANEIKNLADQAKQATSQVRSILGEIQKGINSSVMLTEEAVKRVEAGQEKAEIAEETIRRMSDGMQESIHAFQQIVASTNQQRIGVEQVTQAMKNIRQATEQTAAGTNQLDKATISINAMSQQLRKVVERYRV